MSYKIEQRLLEMVPYKPISGDYKIRLDANESFLGIPEAARKELAEAVASISFNRYPDAYATELCAAFGKFHGVAYDNIMAGNGSDEIINIICQAFLRDNGKVLILPPDFSMYAFYTALRRGQLIEYPTKEDYGADIGEVLSLIKKADADIVIFSNPCNPTSRIIPREDVLYLAKNADCLVVVDEAYMDFSDQSVLDYVCDYPNLIVLRTMSKAFACAALRVGFAVSNKQLTDILKAVKSPYNVNAVSQVFAKILLKYKDEAKAAVRCIIESRDALFEELCALGAVMGSPFAPLRPSANFVFVKTDKAAEIYKKLLSDGIAVRCFEKRLRITAGSKAENAQIIDKLRSY